MSVSEYSALCWRAVRFAPAPKSCDVTNMAIPESTLSSWSHHRSGTASAQANVAIRNALSNHRWPQETRYEVFLQGSYRNATNLRRDSDVDVVIQLATRIRPRVVALEGAQLAANGSHQFQLERWQSFREHALRAMRAEFGDAVTAGRKSLKIGRGRIPANADVVVSLKFEDGMALYVPDERRWIVSHPQRHHQRGTRKENGTGNRFKRTVRMFKAARNHLASNGVIDAGVAPSYFIECLLYNVPNRLFSQQLSATYVDVLQWLASAQAGSFTTQSGNMVLFGSRPEQWNVHQLRRFTAALQQLWNGWR